MQLQPYDVRKFLGIVFRPADSLNIGAVSKKNLPYFISWIGVFIWIYSYFLPMGGFKFESKLYNDNVGNSTIYYSVWLVTGCIIPIVFSGKKFVPKTLYSVMIALLCFIILRYTGASVISKVIMIIASMSMGHIFASNVYAFFMFFNNSEKFYSMLLAVFLPKVLIIAKPLINSESYAVHPPTIIIFSIIIILAACSYFFRFNMEEMPHLDIVKAPVKAYSIMPLIFIILALNDVIAPASLRQIAGGAETSIERYYCLGIILGIAIIILLQKRFSINICNMLNISFALLAIGFTVNLISLENNSAVAASAVCFGTSYSVGFVNIYYLAGFMTKKFQSISFYRVGIVLSTIYYFIAFVTLELFENSTILAPSTLMAFISVCIVIIFFMLSPFFVKMLYSGEWFDDAYRTDVTNCSRLESKLRDFKLTPAEIEVCRLLLEGFTLRQIAGILSRAYSTINTYCTSIYRKLNINSRTELLLVLQNYVEK